MHTPSKGRTFIHLVHKYTYKTGSQTQMSCSEEGYFFKLTWPYYLVKIAVLNTKTFYQAP